MMAEVQSCRAKKGSRHLRRQDNAPSDFACSLRNASVDIRTLSQIAHQLMQSLVCKLVLPVPFSRKVAKGFSVEVVLYRMV